MIELPHGETNITLACQNACVSCNHLAPMWRKPWYAEPNDIWRDMQAASKIVHFKQYAVLGGEPTLHPKILDIIELIRRSGITDRIQLATNGQNCERWDDALYEVIHDLQLTPYKLTAEEMARIVAKCKQYDVVLEWQPTDYFHYVAYKQKQTPGRAADLYRTCWYREWRQVIDDGYFYRCCVGRHIPEMLLGLPREDDAIALEGLTEDKLQAFLSQASVPAACYVCGACNQAPALPWHEQRDPAKWLEESLA